MEKKRETLIVLKGAKFKEEEAKFRMTFRTDFGTPQCTKVSEEIQALGLEPGPDCLAVTFDFETESIAKAAEAAFQKYKQGILFGKPAQLVKVIGKKVIIHALTNKLFAGIISQVTTFASSLGAEAAINQCLELDIAMVEEPVRALLRNVGSLMDRIIDGLRLKLSLASSKEFLMKTAEFMTTLLPASEHERVSLLALSVAAFHNISLSLDLESWNAEMRKAVGSYINMIFSLVFQPPYAAMSMLYDVKQAFGKPLIVKADLCFSPLLSVEFTLQIPEIFDLENLPKTIGLEKESTTT